MLSLSKHSLENNSPLLCCLLTVSVTIKDERPTCMLRGSAHDLYFTIDRLCRLVLLLLLLLQELFQPLLPSEYPAALHVQPSTLGGPQVAFRKQTGCIRKCLQKGDSFLGALPCWDEEDFSMEDYEEADLHDETYDIKV